MAAGFLSGVLSGASAGYEGYARPPLTPPDTTFAIVWPVLYFLTGTSFYLMLNAAVSEKNVAVKKAREEKKAIRGDFRAAVREVLRERNG